MPDQIATESGDNWTVLFFECPTETLQKVLVDLFKYVGKIEGAKIPHFTIREFVVSRRVGISFRVLRNQTSAEIVDSELVKFFEKENLQYQIEPKDNRHAWIRKGTTDLHWNRKRCEALHQLSEIVVFLAQNSLFDTNDKCHMAHYLVNMLALQEATVPRSDQVYFLDIISGNALSFKTQHLGAS